jgi:hypothetical protein
MLHVSQCTTNRGQFDAYNLSDKAAREIDAYNQSIGDIQTWLGDNCANN